MKKMRKSSVFPVVLGLVFLFAMSFLTSEVVAQSTIQGTIYDKQRNRIQDIDIELLDDLYRTKSRTRTDGTGTYVFAGLPNGRYTIKAYAFRFDLEDQEQEVDINTQNIRGGEGAGYFVKDFYLIPKKGGLKESELSVVFAQEIPKEAEDIYDKAVKDLSEKRTDEGVAGLYNAVKTFPDYFNALYRLGKELLIKKQYQDAVPVFLKATQVNQKSANSYYYLGISLNSLGKDYNKAALASANRALVLAPASAQIFWLLGKIERAMGSFPDAEKHLLQAKKLSGSKNPDIQMELAQLYSNDLKKYKEAADELELYMKSIKLTDEEEKKMKKVISDLREKAKTQSS